MSRPPRTPAAPLRLERLEGRAMPSFTVAPSYAVGVNNGNSTKPWSVTLGDFNGDGHLDTATAHTDGNYISVNVGDGSGAIGSSGTISIGRTPEYIGAFDFNGDGFLDLATANKGDNSITVLLATGTGTFATPRTFPVGSGTAPVGLDVADINGDEKLDIVTANSGAETVTKMLGDGLGGFTASGTVNVNSKPTSVVLADLDDNDTPDIATVSGGFGHLNVNLNQGGGTFSAPVHYETGFVANDVVVGDFNRDGAPDLAVGCIFPSDDGISVLMNNGNGTFQPFVSYSAGNQTPGGIEVADLNGDGLQDLVTANFSSTIVFANNSISVLLGKPDGTFGAASVYHAGMGPVSIAAGDVNGDGRQDLVTADAGGSFGTVSVLLGRGDGTVWASEAVPITVRNGASGDGIATGDYTGDGLADLAVVTWNVFYNGITVFPSLGNGRFGPGLQTAAIDGATSVTAGLFNGDQALDLAVTGSAGVTLLVGAGDGTFAAQPAVAAGTSAQWATAADFNGDSKLDLVVANNSGTDGLTFLAGNGNGTFQAAATVSAGMSTFHVASADLNKDGKVDLAAVGSSNVATLLGNGDGTFGAAATFDGGGGPGAVSLGDLNSDGFPDLAVPSFIPPGGGGSAVLVRINNMSGGFPTQSKHLVQSNPIGSAIFDADGDGINDIVVANDFANTLSLLSGLGNGGFRPQATYIVGDRPTWVTGGDFNGDGRIDAAVVNSNSGSVTVLMRPAPATELVATATTGPVTAGTLGQVTVVARDASGRIDPDFRGTVTFSSDDATATLPEAYAFAVGDVGVHTFDFTLRTAGTRSLTVTGPFGPIPLTVEVTPAVADHYEWDVPTAATAGAPFDVTFTAFDEFGNVATDYAGTIHFSSDDPNVAAELPDDYTFTPADGGTHTFTNGLTLATAGARSVTLTPSDLAAQTVPVAVTAAAASRLALTAPGSATAGTAVPVTVAAFDPYGNAATDFTGTVHFATTDPIANLPTDYTFTPDDQGLRTFSVTFKQAAAQSLSVEGDGLTGDQKGGIAVSPAAASQLAFVRGPANTFPNTPLPQPLTVQVVDAYQNPVAVSIPVFINLRANPSIALVKNGTATTDASGRAAFPKLLLTKPGVGYTVLARSSAGNSPVSDPFTVYAANRFKVAVASTKTTAGNSFNVTVTALTPLNKVDPTYRGTVRFTTTSALGVLPPDYTFTEADAGVHTFQVTLNQSGLRVLRVADTNKVAVKGQVTMNVAAAQATQLSITGIPTSLKVNIARTFVVTALDQFGNRATGYVGSIGISSNGTVKIGGAGPTALAPVNYTFKPLEKGRHVFTATFTATGTNLTLTATDLVDGTITGTLAGISVL